MSQQKTKSEGLSEYVRKVMHQKGLTLRQVEQRSSGQITNSYLSKIRSGQYVNLSASKLEALARGLGVSIGDVLTAAGLEKPQDTDEFKESEFALLFFKTQRITDEDDLNELRAVLKMVHSRIDQMLSKKEQSKK